MIRKALPYIVAALLVTLLAACGEGQWGDKFADAWNDVGTSAPVTDVPPTTGEEPPGLEDFGIIDADQNGENDADEPPSLEEFGVTDADGNGVHDADE